MTLFPYWQLVRSIATQNFIRIRPTVLRCKNKIIKIKLMYTKIRIGASATWRSRELTFLLWCAVCSSYAFLRLERSSLRWRWTAVRRRVVCLHFMNVGQLQLSSGNSAPNSGKNRHLTIPFESGMHSFKRQGACVKEIIIQTVWNELDYRVDICRITKGGHREHL